MQPTLTAVEAGLEHEMSRIKAFFRGLLADAHGSGIARGSSVMSVIADDAGIEETLACVREQGALITHANRSLATSLRKRAIADGLQTVEHICATLLVTDELIGFMRRAGASAVALERAYRMRDSMLREAAPWLGAAVRDLPGAQAVVYLFLWAHRRVPEAGPALHRREEGGHA